MKTWSNGIENLTAPPTYQHAQCIAQALGYLTACNQLRLRRVSEVLSSILLVNRHINYDNKNSKAA